MLPISDGLLAHDRNHFTLVRWILASAVIFTHAFDLTGASGGDPMLPILGVAVSGLAVDGFFVVSGFLVAMSLERSRSLVSFAAARFLRIYPALAVVLVLSALALGPAMTSLPLQTYFSDPAIYVYAIQNLIPITFTYDLPGVFTENPFGSAVNGSLWTIRFEIYCYAILAMIAFLGLYRPLGWSAAAVAILALHAVTTILGLTPEGGWLGLTLEQLGRLLPCFAIGVGLYLFRKRVLLSWWIAILLLALWWASANTPIVHLVRTFAFAYLILCVAFLTARTSAPLSKLPDYSYGIYIYAFPVQQALIATEIAADPYSNMIASFFITTILAGFSWNFIEKPALKLKNSKFVQNLAHRYPFQLTRPLQASQTWHDKTP